MPYPINGEEYLDMRDIAALRGVSYTTVAVERSRQELPPAEITIARSPAWRRATILDWLAKRPGLDWAADPARAADVAARSARRSRDTTTGRLLPG